MCPELVVLPKGGFLMGSPPSDIDSPFRERPQHRVTIGVTLAMGRFEVTRAEFEAFARDSQRSMDDPVYRCKVWHPSEGSLRHFGDDTVERSFTNPGFEQSGDHPVTCVSWYDAQAYLHWLSKKAGGAFRLPSEAEWEYAARAGRGGKRYPWGDDLEARAQCQWANAADQSFARLRQDPARWELAVCDDRHTFTAPARAFGPNAFGLYNMHGNVWEWVQDLWHGNYEGAPVDGSAWLNIDPKMLKAWEETHGQARSGNVVRGGAWSSPPENLRSAARSYHSGMARAASIGFRVVRVVQE